MSTANYTPTRGAYRRPKPRKYSTSDQSLRNVRPYPTYRGLTLCQAIEMTDLTPEQVTRIVQMVPGESHVFNGWFYVLREE